MPPTLRRFLLIISLGLLKSSLLFLLDQARRLIAWHDMLVDSIVTHPILRSPPPGAIQSPILPPELWHIVFADLGSSTLRACSLVCRAWASLSRDHLRLEVALHSRERTLQLGRLLRSRVQTLARSAYCVRVNGQDFGQYQRVIRLLHMRGAGANVRRAVIQAAGDVRAMPLLASYFPGIEELTFDSEPRRFEGLWAVYRFLEHLERFRNLRSVSLNLYVAMGFVDEQWVGRRSRFEWQYTRSPFTRLSIRGEWSGCLSLIQRFCGALETLDLQGLGGWEIDFKYTQSMLLANAETLRHLRLTVPGVEALPLDLSVIKRLLSVQLVFGLASRAHFACAVRTVQSLDARRPPAVVCIQACDETSYFTEEFGRVSCEYRGALEQEARRLGLRLVETRSARVLVSERLRS